MSYENQEIKKTLSVTTNCDESKGLNSWVLFY